MRRSALLVIILALLTAGCDSGGGAIGEGSVKDKVPPAEYPTVPQGNPPKLSQLRHDGEVAFEAGRAILATDPKTGQTRKIAGCPVRRSVRECFLGAPLWSPDGTMLAYDLHTCVTHGCGPLDGIWVKQAGQAPRQLTTRCNPGVPTSCAGEAWEWSPTRDVLAYSRIVSTGCCSDRALQSELSLLDPTNDRLTALAHGRGGIYLVAWSPNGSEIAFADAAGISLISPTRGSHPRVIANDVGSVNSIVWSPDGTRLAFDTNQNHRSRIYVMNADGSERRLVADGTSFEGPGAPTWSPDSTRIAYVATPGKPGSFGVQFWVVNADGSSRIAIYDSGCCHGTYFEGPVWSPNGRQIAYLAASRREQEAAHGLPLKWQLASADGSGRPSPVDYILVEEWQQRPHTG